jgi:hypothetical protein
MAHHEGVAVFDSFKDMMANAGEKAGEAGKWLTVIQPVPPYNDKGMVTALITAAGLICTALLAGVGLSALLVLLLSLGLILLVLTRVFGLELDMAPEDIFHF